MIPQSRFGTELRQRRVEAGLSLRQFAELIHYSKGYLSKIETGHRFPSVEFSRLCDAALDASGALIVCENDSALRQLSVLENMQTNQEMWTMAFKPDGGAEFAPINRREVIAYGTTSALGLALAPAAGAADYGMVYAAHLDQFSQLRELGQISSPTFVFPIVIAHVHTLRGLAATATEPDRSPLLRLSSRYAEFAGWMAQEAGDDRIATWCTKTAVELAVAGGDSELSQYALIRYANMAMYRNDAITTIQLAIKAQADATISPRIRGLAAQREAQGHAIAGDYDECHRALDRSAALLDSAIGSDTGPTLGTHNTPDPAAMAAGWCLYELGRPAEAAQILDRETARVRRSAYRTWVRWGTIRALAHCANGEIEHACELARNLIDDAVTVDSATIRQDLRRFAQLIARWRAHPPVRALQPLLSNALHRPA
jgi:transcriptional regulator with XRE-family HTH domain